MSTKGCDFALNLGDIIDGKVNTDEVKDQGMTAEDVLSNVLRAMDAFPMRWYHTYGNHEVRDDAIRCATTLYPVSLTHRFALPWRPSCTLLSLERK